MIDINEYSNMNYYSSTSILILSSSLLFLVIHSFIIVCLIVTDKVLFYIIRKIFKLLTFNRSSFIAAATTALIGTGYINILLNSKRIKFIRPPIYIARLLIILYIVRSIIAVILVAIVIVFLFYLIDFRGRRYLTSTFPPLKRYTIHYS
jgi:protein-S-isoprenylcysteine O-methyltransferase Ste14